MTSAVMEEFLMLCNTKQFLGAAFTPRHQGINERGHQKMLQDHRILMDAVCNAQPQEWSSLVSAVQYLYYVSAQNVLGLSARDMSVGYSIAQDTHKALLPFKVPKGMAGTDICVRLFDNFRNLYSLFMRVTQEEKLKDQARINS